MPFELIAITGCIASGKSAVARGVAGRLRADGLRAAVVDLDLVYEVLAPDPKSDASTWSAARRLAGALAAAAFAEGIGTVIVEGELWTDEHRAELLTRIPAGVRTAWITLSVSFEEALRRAQGDPSRGLSKDPAFLRAHLEQFGLALPALRAATEVIETEGVALAEVVGSVVALVVGGARDGEPRGSS
jgi:predicted kinase